MTTSEAIVVASLVLGACVLVPTGYVFFHDRSVAETQRLEKERAAKAEADFIAKTRAKAAWDHATTGLDVLLEFWINDHAGTQNEKALSERKYRCVHSLSIKSYANSDVTWNDPKTVTVQGIAAVTTVDGHRTQDARAFYAWKFVYVWLDDNRWHDKPGKDQWKIEHVSDPGQIVTDDITLSPNEEAPCQVRL